MGKSFRKEIARKAVHLSALILLIIYIIIKGMFVDNGRQVALLILTTFLIFALIYEYLRLNLKLKLPLSELTRLREKNRHSGLIYLISGMILALAIFDEKVAFAAILMGIFGDLTIGILHGSRVVAFFYKKEKRKLRELFLEFMVNFGVGILVFHNYLVVLVMAITATLVEMIFESEDNLAIPVITGFVGQIMLWIM